jgi:hypothetical protein
MAELHDRSENAALLNLEQGGDWPPSEADISEAAATVGATPPAEPDRDPALEAIEAVLAESEELEASAEIVDSIEAAAPAEVLVDFDVPDDETTAEGPNPGPSDSPDEKATQAADPDGGQEPEASARPDEPGDADAGLVDLGEPASEISPLEALEEFLRRAESRRTRLSPEPTA